MTKTKTENHSSDPNSSLQRLRDRGPEKSGSLSKILLQVFSQAMKCWRGEYILPYGICATTKCQISAGHKSCG